LRASIQILKRISGLFFSSGELIHPDEKYLSSLIQAGLGVWARDGLGEVLLLFNECSSQLTKVRTNP
jgi:hypothetical protein